MPKLMEEDPSPLPRAVGEGLPRACCVAASAERRGDERRGDERSGEALFILSISDMLRYNVYNVVSKTLMAPVLVCKTTKN